MYKKLSSLSALTLSLALLTGCSTTFKNQATSIKVVEAETTVATNDYPTRDRVEYVFNCISKHGGYLLDYVARNNCACKIDKIAEKLTFSEYEAGITFTMLRSTPGENGSVFRDPAHAKTLRTRLKEAEAYAESRCFI